MKNHSQVVIVGAGAAGLSLIIAFYNHMASTSVSLRLRIQKLLESLVILDAADNAGGIMTRYQINANTDAADVVSGIKDGTPFSALRDAYLKLPETQQALIPLPKIGELMLRSLVERVSTLLGERLKLGHRVVRVVGKQGQFVCLDANGQTLAESNNLVLCCGGREVLLSELAAWESKVEFGGEFMRRTSLEKLPQKSGSVVIVGSSHSAFSCAWRLLNDPLLIPYGKGRDIYILQRSKMIKLRCTREFAREQGLLYDEENDVCPISGLVYRNAGLRKDAKALYLKIKNAEENRVAIVPIRQLSDQADLLDRAALILQCTGFHTTWPEIEIGGKMTRLDQHSQHGELHDTESDKIIPGLFACGLGMHINPEAKYGGERSFNGSINGLQSYPLVIAPQIIDQILERL